VTKVELCEACDKSPEACWCYYSASDDDRPRYYWACSSCSQPIEGHEQAECDEKAEG